MKIHCKQCNKLFVYNKSSERKCFKVMDDYCEECLERTMKNLKTYNYCEVCGEKLPSRFCSESCEQHFIFSPGG